MKKLLRAPIVLIILAQIGLAAIFVSLTTSAPPEQGAAPIPPVPMKQCPVVPTASPKTPWQGASTGITATNLTYSKLLARSAMALTNAAAIKQIQNSWGKPSDSTPTPAAVAGIGANERTWVTTSATGQHQKVVEWATGMNYWEGQQWAPSVPQFQAVGDGFAATRMQHSVHISANLNTVAAVTMTLMDGTTLRLTPVAIGLYDAASGKSGIITSIQDCFGVLVDTNQLVFRNAFQGNGLSADIVYTIQRGSFSQDVVVTSRLNPADYGFAPATTRVQIISEFYDPPQPDRMLRPLYIENSPAVRGRMATPDFVDELLGFGQAVIGTGTAYTRTQLAAGQRGAAVAKQFITDTNQSPARSFLLESVRYPAMSAALKALPAFSGPKTALLVPRRNKAPADATAYAAVLPPRCFKPAARVARRVERMAAAAGGDSGVRIDFELTLSGGLYGNLTLQGDNTYFISGPVYTSTLTIEGGSVVKYPTDYGAILCANIAVLCQSQTYRPAIFTAGDDNSIGTDLAGIWSGHNPFGFIQSTGYGNPALALYNGDLNNVRFYYMQLAVLYQGDSGRTISNSQFVNCIRGISIVGYGGGSGDSGGTGWPLSVNNTLMSSSQYPLDIQNETYGGFNNCTLDNCGQIVSASSDVANISFVNCVLANITSIASGANISGMNNGFYNCAAFGTSPISTSTSPFQTSGYGTYYLADNCPFHAAGTTLDSSLVLGKTTHPPLALPTCAVWSGELELLPQAPRYSGGQPDLGYHYDPVDYTVAWVTSEAASITVAPGTAIAFSNLEDPNIGYTWVGFDLLAGSSFLSHGTASNPVTYTLANYVQEGPFVNYQFGMVSFVPDFWPGTTGFENVYDYAAYYYHVPNLNLPETLDGMEPPPIMDFRFCNFYLPTEDTHIWSGYDLFPDSIGSSIGSPDSAMTLTLRDCNVYGGWINLGRSDNGTVSTYNEKTIYGAGAVSLQNCLLDRVVININPTWLSEQYEGGVVNVDMSLSAYNNLFRGGLFVLGPTTSSGGNWIFRDNLFDQPAIIQDSAEPLDYDHNAYWPCASSILNLWNSFLSDCGYLPPPSAGTSWPVATLTSTTTGDGTTDGVGDVPLPSAPPYQTGPLGLYYRIFGEFSG